MESGDDFSNQMDNHRIYHHENEENFEEKIELPTNIITISSSVMNDLTINIIEVVLIWLSG